MQLASIRQRIGNTEQIESIIVAMRAIAATHLQDARRHVEAIRRHRASVTEAMGEALALLEETQRPDPAGDGADGWLLIVVGAGQGFCGLYNETVVQAALACAGEDDAEPDYIVMGQRCLTEFQARGRSPVLGFDQAVRAADVPHLASRVADGLYERLAAGNVRRVAVLHAEPEAGAPVMKQLIPFDYDRIERPAGRNRPLIQMPPLALLAELVTEYVFSELCEALMLGFAAENDARMQAMLRARSNVSHVIDDLKRGYHQARQEQMTAEILELSESF